jgi:hypothetical protein
MLFTKDTNVPIRNLLNIIFYFFNTHSYNTFQLVNTAICVFILMILISLNINYVLRSKLTFGVFLTFIQISP